MFLQNIILSFCKWNTVFTNIILCRTILNHLTWTRAGLPRVADWRSFLRFAPCLFRKTIEIFESKYSRMDLVKIVEDSLSKNWSNMVCLSRPYHFKFVKGCLPQILLGPFLNTLSHLRQKVLMNPYDWLL